MNITLILPFLLFFLTVVINLIIINNKLSKNNQNNKTQKRILEKVRRAEQNLNENLVIIEEKISSQKIEVNNIGSSIDRKIQELNSHSQELAKLTNTLNEYRSMLAILEVSTNKTHEWVVTVRNDCKKLQELQIIIEEHQKSTLDIINSYETAVEKQNKFYGEYENKIELLKISYISEVNDSINLTKENLNSNIISMNQVSNKTLGEIDEAKKVFERLSVDQIAFAKESESILEKFKEERNVNLNKVNEDLNDIVKSKLSVNNSNVENANQEYLLKYTKEINDLNIKKMEEADNALSNLITSINDLKDKKTNQPKIKEHKDNTLTKEKKELKNKKGTSIISDNNNVDKLDKKEKIYEPIGEEEEIVLE